MLRTGILHPQRNALLRASATPIHWSSRTGDFLRGPRFKNIDLALVDDISRVPDVLRAILLNWQCPRIWMAGEFAEHNLPETIKALAPITGGVPIIWQTHAHFKLHVPAAVGLIRTGDTTPHANMILESA